MISIIGTLGVGLICMVMGALISFFITTLSQRKLLNTIAKEITGVHEKIHHKVPVIEEIKQHKESCPAQKDYSSVKAALIFLVTKQDGNINDLGLSK